MYLNVFCFQWSQLGGHLCSGTVTVCGFDQGTQENWLITQHISRELAGGQRLQKVTAQFDIIFNGCDISRQCRQTFDVYKWQISITNEIAARNTNNYEKVDRVSPQVSDGFGSFIESLDIDLDAESGFYLAVVDLSTCMTINRILVFYYVCPAETSQLITRPEVIQAISPDVTIDGECVENSSTQSGSMPLLSCDDEGQWKILIPCHCNPGYELVDGQQQCSGTLYMINTQTLEKDKGMIYKSNPKATTFQRKIAASGGTCIYPRHVHVLYAHTLCTLSHMYICTSDLSSQLECPVGSYSESVSNSPCEPCPANSQSTQTGMAECPCDLEYYRAPDEGPSVACTCEDLGLY